MKLNVNPDFADALENYLSAEKERVLTLTENRSVKILRAGVKERRGKYALILRYQLI